MSKKTNQSPAEKLAASKKSSRPVKRPAFVGVHVCNVRQARDELGLTMDDVAEACGLSKTGLWQVERGNETTLTTARKLAAFFAKSVDDLWPITAANWLPSTQENQGEGGWG